MSTANRIGVLIMGGFIAVALIPGYIGYVGGLKKFNADRTEAYRMDASDRAEFQQNRVNSICPKYQETLAGDNADNIALMKREYGEMCKNWNGK